MLTDMVKDAKVMVVGLALTAMAACTTTNHYYPAGDVVSSSDAKVEYTCESACENIIYICKCTTPTPENLKYCVEQDCGGKKESKIPWSQEKIEYTSKVLCKDAC